jgi:membrane complex biogenesis BtpA family protein
MNTMDFKKKPILGMLHLFGGENVMDRTDDEITIFEEEGVDGYIIENYGGGMEEVRKVLSFIEEFDQYDTMYKGINILPNEFEVAYALAAAYKLDFIQLDYISGTYENPRRPSEKIHLNVPHFKKFRDRFPEIKILGGVHPKYYTPVEGSSLMIDLEDAQERCDAIVVTGAGTGKETPLDKIKDFKGFLGNSLPVIIGAGLDEFNVEEQLAHADGAIVGSYFKTNGQATGKVEKDRVRDFMAKVNKHRVKALL